MKPVTLADRKAATRNQLKQIRAAMTGPERIAASVAITQRLLALAPLRNALSIFAFISYGNEVHTHDLLKQLLEQGKQLAVPKILPAKTMIAVPFRHWADLLPGELGILTPQGDAAYNGNFDVVITPGLGFTVAGHRIGYGRGYYDQWFAAHQSGHKIAVCFEAQITDTLPLDETDVPVDMIVTENRVIIP